MQAGISRSCLREFERNEKHSSCHQSIIFWNTSYYENLSLSSRAENVLEGKSTSLSNVVNAVRSTFSSAHVYEKSKPTKFSHCKTRGWDVLQNPRFNKGLAFTIRERQALGIHGLLPPKTLSADEQAHRVEMNLDALPNDLSRYVALSSLQDRNEKLFYRVLCKNIEKYMPVVYTPTVGLACQQFGIIFQKPKGVYVTIYDNSVERIDNILCAWNETDIRAIVVTDGERILGLGDLGAYGIGIPVGKLSLYVALAGVQPNWCLPVILDVGTDNEVFYDDPYYTGCKQKRVRDIYLGTASVIVAGLLVGAKIANKPLKDQRFLFFGAGEAAIGIARLLCMALQKEGLNFEEAKKRIWMIDINGLLVKNRKDLTSHEAQFAQDQSNMQGLEEIVDFVKPTALIGAAAVSGAFNKSIIEKMTALNERPIIFALSNPTSRAECTAEEAFVHSKGRVIFASGSPFGKVEYEGRTYHPGQGNNSYIFPGVALGAICCTSRHIPDEIFLVAAEVLAGMTSERHIQEGRVYPPINTIPEISVKIAAAVAEYCYEASLALRYPEPHDKEEYIRRQMYSYDYDSYVPDFYALGS
ncbi:malic enzyme, NAD binding domain protein [Trichinella nativa]|uniref:Malic enzyme, NAD binding domain protein n=1 Tax=Trichinella nativa TaxID=6335 RepID=A0A1Y3EFX7_9BILA|nr:malic enzyme, NAD binding domain protein [Trichinella nativa]